MEQVLRLVILAGTTCALATVPETRCDVIWSFSCYPAPGATLYIKLLSNATGYVLVFFKVLPNKNLNLFIVKNGTVKIRESYRNRTEFFIDTGTLKITDVEKSDAGQYSLKVYLPSGPLVQYFSFTLNIKGTSPNSISIKISIFGGLVVIILLVVGFVVWKLKPCRRTGYARLN